MVNLLRGLAVGVDLGRHAIGSTMGSDGSRRGLVRIGGGRSYREGAEWPSECAPKNRPTVLAMCATPGRLDHFAPLLFQQHGEQSALCKGQRRFCHNVHDVLRQAT